MSEETEDLSKKLNDLIEREREIIKKMNVALRAGVNPAILQQMQFFLDECKFAQQEVRTLMKSKDSDKNDFDDFLSIG